MTEPTASGSLGAAAMKFEAEIFDQVFLFRFKEVINMLADGAQTCIFHISADTLKFTVAHAEDEIYSSYELHQECYFTKFEMEGNSEENNEMHLELGLDRFCAAFNAVQNGRALTMKLSSIHPGFLTVCIEKLSLSGKIRIMTHQFPVKIIPRNLVKYML